MPESTPTCPWRERRSSADTEARTRPLRSWEARLGVSVQVGGYEVLGELGRGAAGTVYLARRPGTDRLVAARLLPDVDGGLADGLRDRAAAVAAVQHPHLVLVLDVAEHEGRPLIVTSHFAGGTLAELLERTGTLSPGQTAGLLVAMGAALAAAHSAGLVHGSITPTSILLSESGDPFLDGLGLAGSPSAVRDAAPYGAPEVRAGETPTPRSDVFSLGMVGLEAATGRTPTGGSPLETVWQSAPGVPNELRAALEAALSEDPQRRPGDLAAFATWVRRAVPLEHLANGLPAPAAAPYGTAGLDGRERDLPPEPLTRVARRPEAQLDGGVAGEPPPARRRGALVAVVLLVLVAAAVGGVVGWRSSATERTTLASAAEDDTAEDDAADEPDEQTAGPTPEPTPDSSPSPVGPTVEPVAPDPALAGLRGECARGELGSCDLLAEQAPPGSDDARFGASCGDRPSSGGGSCADREVEVAEAPPPGSGSAAAPRPPAAAPPPAPPPAAQPPVAGLATPTWVVILISLETSIHSESQALGRASEYADQGLPAEVLLSDDFSSLNPGYWVVYVAGWQSEEPAAAYCRSIRDQASACYQRLVSR